MRERKPRAEEQGALDAICAVEDVVAYEWLQESQVANVRTPDLRVRLRSGARATVEIVMATLNPANSLIEAAKKMRPKRFPDLSCEWRVLVSDLAIEKRGSSRRLKEFVAAMVPVFSRAEVLGGSTQAIMKWAKFDLDPDPYEPNRWLEIWQIWREEGRSWEGDFREWVMARLADHCSYWYPPDIVDWWSHDLLPRRVHVLRPPEPITNGCGGIHVHVGMGQEAFVEGDVKDLINAVQQAIDKKERRRQMANVSGNKWLVIPLDGYNAAAQLEEAFGPTARRPHPDLSVVQFSGFDQVWLVAKTFDGKHFVVLRLLSGHRALKCHIVKRPLQSR